MTWSWSDLQWKWPRYVNWLYLVHLQLSTYYIPASMLTNPFSTPPLHHMTSLNATHFGAHVAPSVFVLGGGKDGGKPGRPWFRYFSLSLEGFPCVPSHAPMALVDRWEEDCCCCFVRGQLFILIKQTGFSPCDRPKPSTFSGNVYEGFSGTLVTAGGLDLATGIVMNNTYVSGQEGILEEKKRMWQAR